MATGVKRNHSLFMETRSIDSHLEQSSITTFHVPYGSITKVIFGIRMRQEVMGDAFCRNESEDHSRVERIVTLNVVMNQILMDVCENVVIHSNSQSEQTGPE